MINVLLAHAALGFVLGVGSRVAVLFLPSIAAIIEGVLIANVLSHSFIVGCVVAAAILASVQGGYILGSFASMRKSQAA